MTKQNHLTRTCIACNIQKPLSSFLHLSGIKGTTYGNVCSTCRSTAAKASSKPTHLEDTDETSSTATGLKIDAKAKVQAEQDKKEQAKKTKELDQKESKKRDFLSEKKIEIFETTEQAEKLHRKYIEAKKKGFLGTPGRAEQKTPPLSPNISSVPDQEKQQIEMTQEQEQAAKQNQSTNTIDLSQQNIGAQFYQQKFQGAVFKQYKDWLGGGAFINISDPNYVGKKKMDQKEPEKKLQGEDPLIVEANKKWGPKSQK